MIEIDKIYVFVKSECTRLGISPDRYRIGNDISIEQGELAFDHDGEFWRVYVIERGKEYDIAQFENIFSAIRYFFMELTTGTESLKLPKINFKDLPS